ncbi:hypothetical protein [Nostoc sp.]|uniref:hypothetical protein n=1 Tax=Nostoc sp. TaxID=1180 RepID=UPI002FFBCD9E
MRATRKRSFLPNFYVKLTRMSFFCAQEDVVYLAENSCEKKSSGMRAKDVMCGKLLIIAFGNPLSIVIVPSSNQMDKLMQPIQEDKSLSAKVAQ